MTGTAIASMAMEGSGYYNRNSNLQEAGIRLALPLLEAAAGSVPTDGPVHAPLVIADYGCSQGRNSMHPMALAIDRLRSRVGADRPIEVIHTDLPSNDFASLFAALHDESVSYLANRPGSNRPRTGRKSSPPDRPRWRPAPSWSAFRWAPRRRCMAGTG